MPKARQRYLLAKFTSMKKLKLFLDVAETARQQVRPLQHQLYAHIDEHCRVSHGVIEFDTEIAPFFQQRLEARDHSLAMLAFTSEYKLHVMGNHDVETIQQYIKYIVFSMAKFK